jgi:hypothetical protein
LDPTRFTFGGGSAHDTVMLPLAIIIATVPGETGLVATLRAVRAGGLEPAEILVMDAGVGEDDAAFAQAVGARVIPAPKSGRAAQLVKAAAASAAPWLLFLDAGTRLGAGWADEVAALAVDPLGPGRAFYFRLVFDDPAPAARRLERIAAWRAGQGFPIGAQGLVLSRDLYDRIGGFRAVALLEDADLARRIGRHRLIALATEITVSAERYRRDFWLTRPFRNAAVLLLWFLGVAPNRLRRFRG